MKKLILSVALLLIVSVSYAGDPWYKHRIYFTTPTWWENSWLNRKLESVFCQRDNFVKWLVGNPPACSHKECHL